jgi:hypothetical protein
MHWLCISISCRGFGGALRPGTLWVSGSARGGARSQIVSRSEPPAYARIRHTTEARNVPATYIVTTFSSLYCLYVQK